MGGGQTEGGLTYEGVFLGNETETVALRMWVDRLAAERHLFFQKIRNEHQETDEKRLGRQKKAHFEVYA